MGRAAVANLIVEDDRNEVSRPQIGVWQQVLVFVNCTWSAAMEDDEGWRRGLSQITDNLVVWFCLYGTATPITGTSISPSVILKLAMTVE